MPGSEPGDPTVRQPYDPATVRQPYELDPTAVQQPYLPPTLPYPTAYPPPAPAPYPPVVVVPTQTVIVAATPTSGMAVASMVLAILGLLSSCCAFGIPSILAVIFGHVALAETRHGRKQGRGMAVAGLVIGYLIVVPAIVFSIFMIFGAGMSAVFPHPSPTP